MPYVEVKEEDLKRLRELAGIFEIKDVITKVLDDFLEDYTKPAPAKSSEEVKTFDFSNLPNLSHTKFVTGTFSGVAANAATWNGLLAQAIEVAHQRLGGIAEIRRVAAINIADGEKTDEGYKHIPSLGLSYQGVSAVYAARHIGELGKALSVPVEIEFRWRTKDEAAFPGMAGRLIHNP
ncbi:T4SS efffector SepA family protein [Roseovarius sp. SYSU LYC5161]|uniref:T4SS efffector SepA family protein n=1 Tax=Roseovarius halophilus (ex Wu et al. 2025) TaxID=3376060 RepID=UPI00399B253C